VHSWLGTRLFLAQVKDAVRTGSGPDDWRLTLLGDGDVPVREMLRLLLRDGYDGWVSVEWEKRWHPDIAGPEIALPQHIRLLRRWEAELASSPGG
jgi:fatty-acyl-CoA synthase